MIGDREFARAIDERPKADRPGDLEGTGGPAQRLQARIQGRWVRLPISDPSGTPR